MPRIVGVCGYCGGDVTLVDLEASCPCARGVIPRPFFYPPAYGARINTFHRPPRRRTDHPFEVHEPVPEQEAVKA